MPKFNARDVSVTVNAVDLSDFVKSVTVSEKWDDNEVTGMGAAAKEHLLGIPDASIDIEFFQSFDAGSVDATLQPLAGSNTAFPVVIKPTSAAVSVTNPSYTMQALLPEYSALDASVGQPSMNKVKFVNGDPSGIVKATS